MKKTLILFVSLFSLESFGMGFSFVNEKCGFLSNALLPNEALITTVEHHIGKSIPESLRSFYLESGNRQISGYDMAYVQGGINSSLVGLQEKAKEENVPEAYFAFARDNSESLFCLEIGTGNVIVYNTYDQIVTNERWNNLESFLRAIIPD